MKLEMFHLMPYRELPEDFAEKYRSVWVDIPSHLFDPERAHEMLPDKVVSSELKSSSANTKVVEIRGKVLNLPIQRLVIEYTLYPNEKRITSRTLDYNLADINSEYKFEPSPDGKKTLLRFTQTSKDKLGNPLPESVQKGALKETYVTTVRTVKKSLGLS